VPLVTGLPAASNAVTVVVFVGFAVTSWKAPPLGAVKYTNGSPWPSVAWSCPFQSSVTVQSEYRSTFASACTPDSPTAKSWYSRLLFR
jgi:hypothetical protein